MPAGKGRSRVRFTPELWAKWLARRDTPPDARDLKRRDGIEWTRRELENRRHRMTDE